ncbi:NAD(P)H-dependent oxidoreductase [Parvibaculaceae bacterium PLY_AMNH_Bact1]|nr:NAD(P)H-dependent oxidoreductase [Parvibaculaceae bacterium PLY_AMNH_Bact1]
MHILGLSGSLRAASLNTRLLRATKLLTPKHMTFEVFHGLGSLPIFNPDLENQTPEAVRLFQATLSKADAVLIASPEYAHGVTGVIKNALDWVVASAEFSGKPTAVLNTASRSHHAWEALKETLNTMDANLIEQACLTVSLTGIEMNEDAMSRDPGIKTSMACCLKTLHKAATALNTR